MRGKFKHGGDVIDSMTCGSHISGRMGQRGTTRGTWRGGIGRSRQKIARPWPALTGKDVTVVSQRKPTICFRPFDLLENY